MKLVGVGVYSPFSLYTKLTRIRKTPISITIILFLRLQNCWTLDWRTCLCDCYLCVYLVLQLQMYCPKQISLIGQIKYPRHYFYTGTTNIKQSWIILTRIWWLKSVKSKVPDLERTFLEATSFWPMRVLLTVPVPVRRCVCCRANQHWNWWILPDLPSWLNWPCFLYNNVV